MKKLLLLLFLIPNLVMGESYLCISENSAGMKIDRNNKTRKDTAFKVNSKYIVKKIKGEWRFKYFGEADDDIDVLDTSCQIKNSSSYKDYDPYFLVCNRWNNIFKINFGELRFISVAYGSWIIPSDPMLLEDTIIDMGSCSGI